jgi:hypothetical protein
MQIPIASLVIIASVALTRKNSFRAVALLCVLLTLASQAKADQITTFDVVNAKLADGSAVTGTLNIDTTSGVATSANITIGPPSGVVVFAPQSPSAPPAPTPSQPASAFVTSDIYMNSLYDDTPGTVQISFNHSFPTGTPYLALLVNSSTSTLVNFDGAPLLLPSDNSPATYSVYGLSGLSGIPFVSGSLAPVPEPSTVTLLSTGFLAIGGFGFWRRRASRHGMG